MLVLSDVQLAELMRTTPAVAAKIHSAAAERLARG
jgi:hypothetical protein